MRKKAQKIDFNAISQRRNNSFYSNRFKYLIMNCLYKGRIINHDIILAVLPSNKDNAKSLKEIANEMSLDINRYVDWIRVERRLSSSLRALARWGWVDLERRQREEGHKFWYNAYWKTEFATQSEENMLS